MDLNGLETNLNLFKWTGTDRKGLEMDMNGHKTDMNRLKTDMNWLEMDLNGLETAEIALSLDRNQLQREKKNETFQKRFKMNKNNLKRN